MAQGQLAHALATHLNSSDATPDASRKHHAWYRTATFSYHVDQVLGVIKHVRLRCKRVALLVQARGGGHARSHTGGLACGAQTQRVAESSPMQWVAHLPPPLVVLIRRCSTVCWKLALGSELSGIFFTFAVGGHAWPA